jgi:hypothetical protein
VRSRHLIVGVALTFPRIVLERATVQQSLTTLRMALRQAVRCK